MYDCLVIGDTTIDTFLLIDHANIHCNVHGEACQICFDFGGKIPIKTSSQSIGGNAANVSTALARLGAEVGIISEIGDDVNGTTAHNQLQQVGVDTRYVNIKKNSQTRYSMIINYHSDRTVFSYYAPREYSFPALAQTEWVYYTSLGGTFELLQKKLIKHLQTFSEIRLAVNPGSYQINDGIRSFKKILPFTELLFVNKEEASMLTHKKNTLEESAIALCTIGVTVVIITDGDAGAYSYDGKELLHMPPYPVEPISKTGAGDAFASAFLAGYIDNQPIKKCLQLGTANASSVIKNIGAQDGQQTEPELEKIISFYKNIVPKKINSVQ